MPTELERAEQAIRTDFKSAGLPEGFWNQFKSYLALKSAETAISTIPNATNLVSGIMKLYGITGSNADGTMTQASINSSIASAISNILASVPTDGDNLNKINSKVLALQAIVGSTVPDGDSIVDTLTELLAVFSTYSESVDIATLLGQKLNTTDVYNALDQLLSGKALDARQGKVLNDAIGLKFDKTGGTATGNILAPNISGANTGDETTSTILNKIGDGSLINQAYLPSYVDDVLEYINFAAFPVSGDAGKIYIDKATNKQWRWSGSVYIQITNGLIGSTSDIPEGLNLYWTTARGLAILLAGLSSSSGTFSASDTLLTALGKIKFLIDNIATTYQTQAADALAMSSLNATNLTSGTVPPARIPTNIPVWKKVTKTFTDFAAAATTNTIDIYSAIAGETIHAVLMKHNTAFGGGTITTYTISVGINGTLNKYIVPSDVKAVVSGTIFYTSTTLTTPAPNSFISAVAIRATANCTTVNTNQATTGSVDFYILTTVLS